MIEAVGEDRDGAARDDLADEDHTAADFIVDGAADVVAEVDLGEAAVAGDGKAEEPHVLETEADDADVGLAIVQVGLGTWWGEAHDELGRRGEV